MLQNKTGTSGVIMASGEGSRMHFLREMTGLPKHLLPIGHTTIVSRTATEIAQCCDEIICITPPHFQHHFETEFHSKNLSVRVIPKTIQGFKGDFTAAAQSAKYRDILLTVGDIIFPDNEITAFKNRTDNDHNKLVLAFDKQRLRVLKFPTIVDYRMVLARMPVDILKNLIGINPEALLEVIRHSVRLLLQKQITFALVNTLFNVNTIQAYHQAKAYFSARQ